MSESLVGIDFSDDMQCSSISAFFQLSLRITRLTSQRSAMVCRCVLKLPTCRLDDVHVDEIVAEVLRRLDRPKFDAPKYALDVDARAQVQHSMRGMHIYHA